MQVNRLALGLLSLREVSHKLPVRGTGIRQPRAFLDVTNFRLHDAGAGIHTVVRGILESAEEFRAAGIEPVPVFWNPRKRRFESTTLGELGLETARHPAFPGGRRISPSPGDIFIGLDLYHASVLKNNSRFGRWRRRGVDAYAVLYDLLPATHPQWFPERFGEIHSQWLRDLMALTGVLTISRTVSDDFRNWMRLQGLQPRRDFVIEHFPLSGQPAPSRGKSEISQPRALRSIAEGTPRILMVGTVEPRKGYSLALDAWKQLHAMIPNLELIIVGRKGWKSEDIWNSLDEQQARGIGLTWLQDASPAEVEWLYRHSTVLLAASEGEGFGLPLVEAFSRGLPVMARDIPVFREIAGDFADFFPQEASSAELADALASWFRASQGTPRPDSGQVVASSWKDSAQGIIEIVLSDRQRPIPRET